MHTHILERTRAARDWSRADAADALGVTREAIRLVELGRVRPSPDLAWAIVRLAEESGLAASLSDIYPPPAEGAA